MEEKVNFYTASSLLADLAQETFKKKIGRNRAGYVFNSLNEKDLSQFLDTLEPNLDNEIYRVLYEKSDSQIARERFSNGLIFENKANSKTYTQNGISFRLVG